MTGNSVKGIGSQQSVLFLLYKTDDANVSIVIELGTANQSESVP